MKCLIVPLAVLLLIVTSFTNAQDNPKSLFIKEKIDEFVTRYTQMVKILNDSVKSPRTYKNGQIYCVRTDDSTTDSVAAFGIYMNITKVNNGLKLL